MNDLPEDEVPHHVDSIEHVAICAFCLRPIHPVGPDYKRWEHDEARLNPGEK